MEVKRRNSKGEMEVYYMQADVPSWDVEDVRAMYLEDTLGDQCDNAEDLFAKVQTVRPSLSALVVPDPVKKGVVMVRNRAAYDSLPKFSWWEIFTFNGVTPPKGCKPPKK